MTEATNEAMEYKTLYTRTEIHYDEHGVPFDVPKLNRGMSVHGHHCQTKEEFYDQINKLCFVEYVMRTDPMNWLIVCKGKWNKEEPFFTAYWEPDCSKHSEDAFCITEFMTEGIPEMYQAVQKVSSVRFSDTNAVTDKAMKKLFNHKTTEKLKELEEYLMYEIEFDIADMSIAK